MGSPESSPPPQRFERIYRENFRFVWGAAKRLGVPDHGLEDAVQDVFSTTYGKLEQIDPEAPIRAWLWGVTRRVAFRHRRTAARTRRRRAAVADVETGAEDPRPRHHAARWVDRFLDTLDTSQRDAFVMAELLGMSAVEIAAEQQVPVNTVYSRLRLARRHLARLAQSPEHARVLVQDARGDLKPPPRARARTWAALLPIVRGTTTAAVATTSVAAPATGAWLWLGALPLGLGLLVAATTVGAVSSPAPSPAAATVAKPAALRLPIPDPTPPALPQPRSKPESESESESGSESESESRPKPKPEPAVVSETMLAAEVRVLDAARSALDHGNPASALRHTQIHTQRFSQGQLVDVRMAIRVQALCALGQATEAEAAREALLRAYPASNVARTEALKCR